MDPQANKILVKSYLEIWNTRKVELVQEVPARGRLGYAHPQGGGLEGVKQSVQKIQAGFPDFYIKVGLASGAKGRTTWGWVTRATSRTARLAC